jgi:hypothetical protein
MKDDMDTLEDIYRERARYLLNTDEMMQEMIINARRGMTDNLNAGFPGNRGTVCCGALIDMDGTQENEMRTSEKFPVCSNNCGRFTKIVTT